MDLEEFKKKYSTSDILNYIDSIKNIKTLIIGDPIIDIYQYGYSMGKSSKSPVVAFKLEKKEEYEGGSFVIRRHLKEYIDKLDMIVGKQQIIKTRYIENNQKLFETYSFNDTYDWDYPDIKDFDLVIVADFGHGLLTKEFREKILKEANYIGVTTQINAHNMGFNSIRKYMPRKKNIYICIDEYELRMATHEKYSLEEPLYNIILNERYNFDKLAVTMGKDGCIVLNDKIIKFPAFSKKIVDTIGAGDAFLSITSPLAYINSPPEIIAFLGNIAGAIACSYPCNKENLTKSKVKEFTKDIYGE
jgi:bifunctional ADP-heptose synthase (sugar kinase/adenylyltransferase)